MYRANTFVMFINSKHAIHSVTPRTETRFSRRLVNIIAVRHQGGRGRQPSRNDNSLEEEEEPRLSNLFGLYGKK
jgi:hypothetical protein